MNTFTVSFFGHRSIENALEVENRLRRLIHTMLREHEYVEFLVGRDGEFDQIVSSTVRRCKREYQNDNSAHVWVLPYPTAEFRNNEGTYREYYDEIETATLPLTVTSRVLIKQETGQWSTALTSLCFVSSTKAVEPGKP